MTTSRHPELVCNLGAFNEQQRERYRNVCAEMDAGVQEIRELENGYAFRYPATSQWLLRLAEFIVLERLCCPFFSFALELEADSDSLQLSLTGNAWVKAFLAKQTGR